VSTETGDLHGEDDAPLGCVCLGRRVEALTGESPVDTDLAKSMAAYVGRAPRRFAIQRMATSSKSGPVRPGAVKKFGEVVAFEDPLQRLFLARKSRVVENTPQVGREPFRVCK
jgi:hypothetical protein